MFCKVLPWFLLALFATEIVAILMPKKEGEFHTREFARLPVLLNGRIQPFDSVAANSLLQIRSTADVPLEEVPSWKFWHHPKKLKATEWLLEVMLRPEQADDRPIFLIHHPELLAEFKLTEQGVKKSLLRYYTFNQLQPSLREIWEQGLKAREMDEKLRTPLQKQIVKLQNAVFLYQKLKGTLRPPDSEDFSEELARIRAGMTAGLAAMQARENGQPYDGESFTNFWGQLKPFLALANEGNAGQAYPLVVPPVRPQVARDDWSNIGLGVLESVRSREIYPPVSWFADMSTAYSQGKPGEFNRAVAEYKQWLNQKFPAESKKGRREFFYNDSKAFLHAMIIYLCAFILAKAALLCISLAPNLSESLRRSAFYLVVLAGVVHTAGLIFRMVLEGRPPVTNLYSSAIFIGWGAMLLGIVLERIYRVGIGSAVAAVAGFVTLVIAHNLALGGDTMEMLRAVLDTNFWLATHVVVVTLGYASTFVAGLLAILYIFLGLFTPVLAQRLDARGAATASAATGLAAGPRAGVAAAKNLSPDVGGTEVGKALAKMVYGIVCFATLFSFVGTVLGGIWADQSWGRFWGWDPKENGALIIVLWNAAILHARWGGLVRERGLINMAVIGNIVTSFSWFGVNMLGIGLHSYGFMDAAFKWLMLFVASQLFIIVLGLLPKSLWRSFRSPPPPSSPSSPGRGVAPGPMAAPNPQHAASRAG